MNYPVFLCSNAACKCSKPRSETPVFKKAKLSLLRQRSYMVWRQFCAPFTYPSRGELHYPSNRRICGSEGGSERFFFGGKEILVPRIFSRKLRDLVNVPTELSRVSLSVRCIKQTVLSNDKLIQILNFV